MIERYEGIELSIESALTRLPQQYRQRVEWAYRWFAEHEGYVGPRPYGKHTPKDAPIILAAQRGIHKPGVLPIALSVYSSGNSFYAKDSLHTLDDQTWILQYCEHERNQGETVGSSVYNASLRLCLKEGFPVGVFVPEGADYRCLGLAFVEQYNPETKFFWLHGPVRPHAEASLAPVRADFVDLTDGAPNVEFDSSDKTLELLSEELIDSEDRRDRVIAEVVRRKQQGLFRKQVLEAYNGCCAISSYKTLDVLQAAHISSYLGPKSQLVTNGILLRADLHILYDRALLSVRPDDLKVQTSPMLAGTRYELLDGKPIRLPSNKTLWPSEPRLAAKHSEFLLANGLAR